VVSSFAVVGVFTNNIFFAVDQEPVGTGRDLSARILRQSILQENSKRHYQPDEISPIVEMTKND
jgi:hypothetical protein